jgi:hypothetical protein
VSRIGNILYAIEPPQLRLKPAPKRRRRHETVMTLSSPDLHVGQRSPASAFVRLVYLPRQRSKSHS